MTTIIVYTSRIVKSLSLSVCMSSQSYSFIQTNQNQTTKTNQNTKHQNNNKDLPTVYILVVTRTSSFPRFTSSTTRFNNRSHILADSIVDRRACDVINVVIRLTSSGVSGASMLLLLLVVVFELMELVREVSSLVVVLECC